MPLYYFPTAKERSQNSHAHVVVWYHKKVRLPLPVFHTDACEEESSDEILVTNDGHLHFRLVDELLLSHDCKRASVRCTLK